MEKNDIDNFQPATRSSCKAKRESAAKIEAIKAKQIESDFSDEDSDSNSPVSSDVESEDEKKNPKKQKLTTPSQRPLPKPKKVKSDTGK